MIMTQVNKGSFMSSFPISMPFISFSGLIAVARTSRTTLKRRGERGTSFLVSGLNGKASSFAPLNMILALVSFCGNSLSS